MFYSIIIAVYQRADELTELLQSLSVQNLKHFEVVIVDDGSNPPLKPVVDKFKELLEIQYHHKTNEGPAAARNFGMRQAKGDYFIFLDSDTIAPPNYLQTIDSALEENYTDFFGGPDQASHDFSHWQKAINYAMTSMLTTGGIRGKKNAVGKFQPRSFNMGLSRKANENSKGFGELRYGEDPDLSMKLWEMGFKSQLVPQAAVIHKRRSTASSFYKQVRNFGIARPILNQRHPAYKKISFWFPSLFVLGFIASLLLLLFQLAFGVYLYAFHALILFIDSTIRNKSIQVGALSVWATWIQFWSYGVGFLQSYIKLNIFRIPAKKAFPRHFRS